MDGYQLQLPMALTVSDLTRYLRDLLAEDPGLQNIWVEGEVSNFSRPSSGHLYFTLKDQAAALRCVMWRSHAMRQSYLPADGAAVQVHGSIGIYEAGGQYQLYADLIRPVGEGALYQEFLRLKARLEAEGLFDEARKRPVPAWPRRIGIVTSPTGAALRDMLNTIRRRYPLAEVILAPTAVQGEEAPAQIAAALVGLNQLNSLPDVILLARGGGSIEDLWAFNAENVARAISTSQVPIISGVGHETDFTIADFVADLRAPTPTAAAELATPDQLDLRAELESLDTALVSLTKEAVDSRALLLQGASHRLDLRSPLNRVRSERQRLDELEHRLQSGLRHHFSIASLRLQSLQHRMEALSPFSILQRGYALVNRPDGVNISRAAQVQSGDPLILHFTDGHVTTQAIQVTLDKKTHE
jgi:exodeoxyribonuclease VII large subunit